MTDSIIPFTKVALPYGWLGNMSPFSIEFEGESWRTSEALFQALRFDDPSIREQIRSQKSPMAAKMVAKKNRSAAKIVGGSDTDLANMEMCIRLKLEQHPQLVKELILTGDAIIIEDATSRGARGSNIFWGAVRVNDGWIGENMLGKIWMKMRDSLRKKV